MKQSLLRWLPIPVLVAGSLATWLVAQGRPAQVGVRPDYKGPLVQVVEVQPRDVRTTVHTHGTVVPHTEIDLTTEVPGRVISVSPSLAAGGSFEAGEVLAELDPHDARLILDRGRAMLTRIENEGSLAALRLRRLRVLAEREIISVAELEEADYQNRIAEAQVAEGRAAVALAQRDLERTRIRAPFAGRVRSKRVDIGQFITRGTPLARIYATGTLEVRLPIPTSELAYLDLSSLDRKTGPVVQLKARLAGRETDWVGRIVRSEGEIAARSRMLHLVARVEDPPRDVVNVGMTVAPPSMTVGLFVDAVILGRTMKGVFTLPRSALVGHAEVMVVDDESRLRARSVDVVRVDGDEVVVSTGLVAGEHVATSPVHANEGARVRMALAEVRPEP